MIDTHCHLLPLCDDGPENWAQSLEIAAEAVRQGIKTVFATPHHMKGQYKNDADKIAFLVRKMNNELANANIPLQVLPGQEFHLGPQFHKNFGNHGVQLLGNSKYLLVELPTRDTPQAMIAFIRDCRAEGIVPIIAHPERHAPFIRDPDKLYEMIASGALAQLTAPSLVGQHGYEVQQAAIQMAKKRWVHLLASDAHDMVKRGIRLREAYWVFESLIGKPSAEQLRENAESLLAGRELSIGDPVVPRHMKSWWALTFRK
ncbi:tyrosine-protein phosphatase [Cohnella yongneupensis]|uniref:Tyrosine-protein phosphatase n=1 Tax=Cohnella yongneupensis TaxID=425006 RepID=A0ABW0R312_9BACL